MACGNAVFGTYGIHTVVDCMNAHFCQQGRHKGRGRQTTVVTIVGIGDIDHFIHLGRDTLCRLQNGIQNALVFSFGFALHAQGNKENSGLYGVYLVFQNAFHAQIGFFLADIFG